MNTRIKIGSILLYIAATALLIFGLIYCFISTPMPYHLKLMERTFESMKNELPKVTSLMMGLIRLVGCCLICIASFLYGIIPTAYRRTERWVLFGGMPGLVIIGSYLVYFTFHFDVPIKWLMAGFLIFILAGALLPVKEFLKNDYH